MGTIVMTGAIKSVLSAERVISDGDMLLYRALPGDGLDALGPFVFLDHYRSRTQRGIGDRPHPHAGIELLSYLLEGGIEHRDSMGFRDRLGPGDAQWIRAGRGMLHAEQPLGGRHGVQLWAMLPEAERFAEPTYRSWHSADLPQVEQPGAMVRVLAGPVAGVTGPMVFATPATFAHVRLQPGSRMSLAVDPVAELGVYVLGGSVGCGEGPALNAGSLALLTQAEEITLFNASDEVADVAVLGGQPAERPILFSGPFVMATADELRRAKQAYSSGGMGRLEGVPF